MAGDPAQQDEMVSQFCGMTGVAPSEVYLFPIDDCLRGEGFDGAFLTALVGTTVSRYKPLGC